MKTTDCVAWVSSAAWLRLEEQARPKNAGARLRKILLTINNDDDDDEDDRRPPVYNLCMSITI